ncbi:MAG: hypothetical protein AAF092_17065 [Pseudomonadota bacterium]
MAIENLILGISIHLLFYEHLPHWGTWFMAGIRRLPQPLQTLYEQWRCPYCAGFWIGLVLHALTGTWFLAAFDGAFSVLGPFAEVASWCADGLAFAVMSKLGVMALSALAYPAILGMQKKAEVFGGPSD